MCGGWTILCARARPQKITSLLILLPCRTFSFLYSSSFQRRLEFGVQVGEHRSVRLAIRSSKVMFSKERAKPSSSSLDLSSLQSYSPGWSPHLRLATCISLKYAVQRHVERATALSRSASASATSAASGSPFYSASQEWSDYGDKFLTATCQHLGISESSLPPGPIGLEDVLAAAHGRLEHADTRESDLSERAAV